MAERLYALRERTAQRVRQLTEDGGSLAPAATGGGTAAARGVTWVLIEDVADEDGWHPGRVSIDQAGEWQDLAAEVWVQSQDGRSLKVGDRVLCTRTANDSDGLPQFRTYTGFVPFKNLLINGSFAVYQRFKIRSKHLSGNYTFDRWYTQHNGGNTIAFVTGYSLEAGTNTFGQITNTGNSAAGAILTQPMEAQAAKKVKSFPHSLSLEALTSAGNISIDLKLFAYNGSSAAGYKNIVSSWSGNNTPVYATANLTLVANATFEANSSGWNSGGVDFVYSFPGSNYTLVPVIEVGNIPAGQSVYVRKAAISKLGSEWEEPDVTAELAECLRFYFHPRYQLLTGTFIEPSWAGTGYGNGVMCTLTLPAMRSFPAIEHAITGVGSGHVGNAILVFDLAQRYSEAVSDATVAAGNLTVYHQQATDNYNAGGYASISPTTINLVVTTTPSAGNWTLSPVIFGANGSIANAPKMGEAVQILGAINSIAFSAEI